MNEKPLSFLPPQENLMTDFVVKHLIEASRELAMLNGFARTIPNGAILINTLSLQEAKDSSEIESIITTNDELYRADLFDNQLFMSPRAKEVKNYAKALNAGCEKVKKERLLTVNHICDIQRVIEGNAAGIRKQMGTVIMNAQTKEIVHTPPQQYDEIVMLLTNLERIINDDAFWPGVDPLVKMAVIHYQFESIHPFLDGNGRTGRIINVLYLVLKNLLDMPILYISRYIISHKENYYKVLQQVRKTNDWESFIVFMLDAITETAKMTSVTIQNIRQAMFDTKQLIRDKHSFYRSDLVDALFLHPYTRVLQFQKHLGISRNTATSYLNKLSEDGILSRQKLGKYLFFINKRLFDILSAIPSESDKNAPELITENRPLA